MTVETVRVTKNFGKTLDNLETLWFLRDAAERRLADHVRGANLTGDEWMIVNIPNERMADPIADIRPEWKKFKAEWDQEMLELAELAWAARRAVRIATGHEPIGKMVCR